MLIKENAIRKEKRISFCEYKNITYLYRINENMKLKDLTKEQAIEIAKLVYGFPDYIKSDFEVKYQPYDVTMYEDAREVMSIFFDAITFGDNVDKIMIEICPSLNCWAYYCRDMAYSLPTRNQKLTQEKFKEWNLL